MKRPSHRERHEAEGIFNLKKNPGPGICMVTGCRKEGHSHKFSLCHAHYQYRWRMVSRKPSAFATLRDHAKARGLDFDLSYDYFLGLMDCAAAWDMNAESRGEWASIDRIDPTKGYVKGNLRVITQSDNSAKSNRERHLPAHVQAILNRKRERVKSNPYLTNELEDSCPF